MSKDTLVSQFFVAGLIFSDYGKAKIARGQRISLVKEPTNLMDNRAIRVYLKGRHQTHIGWVPRAQTHEIRNFTGKVTHAEIQAYAPCNATHRMVLVNVYGRSLSSDASNTIC